MLLVVQIKYAKKKYGSVTAIEAQGVTLGTLL